MCAATAEPLIWRLRRQADMSQLEAFKHRRALEILERRPELRSCSSCCDRFLSTEPCGAARPAAKVDAPALDFEVACKRDLLPTDGG